MLEFIYSYIHSFIIEYGNIGIGIYAYLEAIIVPVPVDPFIIAFVSSGGITYQILLFAITGTILGAITSYFLGKFLGDTVFLKIFNEKLLKKGESFFEKFGVWAIMIGSLTPLPFNATAWMSGIFEMPFYKFIIASFIGRAIRYSLVAYATGFAIKIFFLN